MLTTTGALVVELETYSSTPICPAACRAAVESLAGLIERIAADEAQAGSVVPPPEGVRQTLVHLSEQHPVFFRARAAYRTVKTGTSRIRVRRR